MKFFLKVFTLDENGTPQWQNKTCVFPFKYKSITYLTCINNDQTDYWCSLTDDFDRDQQRGKCSLGLTSNAQFEVCALSTASSNYRRFTCPVGYVIEVVTAEYVITTDGSCDYK